MNANAYGSNYNYRNRCIDRLVFVFVCVWIYIYMIQLLSPRSLSIIIQIVADLPVCASKAEWFLLRVRRPPWPLYNTTHTQYMRTHFSSISHKEKTLRALIHNHPDPKDQPENNSNNNNNNNTQQKQKKERKKTNNRWTKRDWKNIVMSEKFIIVYEILCALNASTQSHSSRSFVRLLFLSFAQLGER